MTLLRNLTRAVIGDFAKALFPMGKKKDTEGYDGVAASYATFQNAILEGNVPVISKIPIDDFVLTTTNSSVTVTLDKTKFIEFLGEAFDEDFTGKLHASLYATFEHATDLTGSFRTRINMAGNNASALRSAESDGSTNVETTSVNGDRSNFTANSTFSAYFEASNVASATSTDVTVTGAYVRVFAYIEPEGTTTLTEAQAIDPEDTTEGYVSGELLAESISQNTYQTSTRRYAVASSALVGNNQFRQVSVPGTTDQYYITINSESPLYGNLSKSFLHTLTRNQKIKIYNASRSMSWTGEIISDITVGGNNFTFIVDYSDTQGSYQTGEVITIYFGYPTNPPLDQVANADSELLWRHTTDYAGGAGSSSTTRNLLSGKSFTDYSLILFWLGFGGSNDEPGIFKIITRAQWENISDGIGDLTIGDAYMYSRSGYIAIRYIDEDSFRVTANDDLYVRAIYGIKGI